MSKYDKIDRSKLNEKGKSVYDRLKKDTNDFKSVAGKRKEVLDKILAKQESLKSKSAPKKSKKKSSKKKKSKAPINKGTNRGSFAKLRAAIAKRDGISYKAALPIAKKEYAAQKNEKTEKKRSKYKGRLDAFKRKYKGKGTRFVMEKGELRPLDVDKDAKIPAKAVGKRISEGKGKNQYGKSTKGNVYYEYRDNRTDQRQPQPTNIPRLEEGGLVDDMYWEESKFAKGGTIYDIGDEVKDRRFGNDLGVIKGYNEEYYFIKHQDGEDATGLMFWIGQEDEEDRGRYYNPNEIILSEDYDDYENDRFARYKVMVGEEEESDDLTKDDAEDLAYRLKRIGAKDVKVERMIYAKGGKLKKKGLEEKAFKYWSEAQPKDVNGNLISFEDFKKDMKKSFPKEFYAKGGKTDETFIQDAVKEMEKEGTVGAFSAKAKKAGMTTVNYAKKVLTKPEDFSEKTRKQAQFMKNINPELFNFGGEITRNYDVKSPLGTYAAGGEITEAGDVDYPNELLNYAQGGQVSKGIVRNQEENYILRLAIVYSMKKFNEVDRDILNKIYDRIVKFSNNYGKMAQGGELLDADTDVEYAKGGRQGYDDKLDESLGNRRGKRSKKRQNYKDRRDESKGMERARYRRAYSSVGTMDKRERYL